MRVAVVGAHGSGKTTLVEAFLAGAPGYRHEAEPYHQLTELGAQFSLPPTFEDYLELAAFSVRGVLRSAAAGEGDVIFDRCPFDLLAYLEVVGERERRAPPAALQERAEEAVRTLGLVVFLPLSQPDEIGAVEYPKLRARVDRRLKAMLRGDEWGVFGGEGPRLVEIRGTVERRVEALRRAVGV